MDLMNSTKLCFGCRERDHAEKANRTVTYTFRLSLEKGQWSLGPACVGETANHVCPYVLEMTLLETPRERIVTPSILAFLSQKVEEGSLMVLPVTIGFAACFLIKDGFIHQYNVGIPGESELDVEVFFGKLSFDYKTELEEAIRDLDEGRLRHVLKRLSLHILRYISSECQKP